MAEQTELETTAGLGESLGLQTNSTSSYNGAPLQRAVQMGMQAQLRQDALAAKQVAEKDKLAKEIDKYITFKGAKLRKPYSDIVRKEIAQVKAEALMNPSEARMIMDDYTQRVYDLKVRSDDDDRLINTGLNASNLSDPMVINAIKSDNLDDRKKIDVRLSDIYTPDNSFDNVPTFTVTSIPKIDLKREYQKDIETLLRSKGWDESGGLNEQYYKAIKSLDNEELTYLATRRADDKTSRANIIEANKQRAYEIFSKLPVDIQDNLETAKRLVAAELFKEDYLKEKGEKEILLKKYAPKDVGIFVSGGGYKTPNKWILQPANTTNKRQQLIKNLNSFNEKIGTNYTFEEFYKDANAKTENYNEVFFENQDVSENKPFQYTDENGGLVNVIPISIRRPAGATEKDWKLIGKKENPNYEPRFMSASEKFIDVELPYNEAVREKTDVIIGADTKSILAKMFPNKAVNKKAADNKKTQKELTWAEKQAAKKKQK